MYDIRQFKNESSLLKTERKCHIVTVNLLQESQDIIDWLDPQFEDFMRLRGWGVVTRPNFHEASDDQRLWCKKFYQRTGKIPNEDWVTMVVFHFTFSEVLNEVVCLCWEECSGQRFNRLEKEGKV